MQKFAGLIDKLNDFLGKTISWLTLFMVVVMFVSVIQRYFFQSNYIWQQELIGFMHAVVFLTAAGFTLQYNNHVRVDLFYQKFSEKTKAWVNLFGTVMFLFPVCFVLIYFSFDFIVGSWRIFEGSREYGGLPGVFILKTFIWVFAVTLILQGISLIINCVAKIRS